jgi:PAT family beta-lactamase induction signal transducer AmpG
MIARLKNRLGAAGVYLDRRVAVMLFFGFSSGLPLALTASTLAVWMTERGVSLADIGAFALVGTPYTLKFLWAPLMDRLALGGLTGRLGRRRGWMLATQAGLIAALVALAFAGAQASLGVVAGLAFLIAVLSASQDIVIDAYRVESLAEHQLGAGTAMHVYGYRLAMLAAGAGPLIIASYASWMAAYLTMAGLMAVGVAAALLNPEPAAAGAQAVHVLDEKARSWLAMRPHITGRARAVLAWLFVAVVAPFADFMKRRGWLAIFLFVVLYKLGDSLAGVMTSPFLIKLGFSKPEIAGVQKLWGTLGTLGGLGLGGMLLEKTGILRALMICGVLQLVSNFMFALQAVIGADVALLALTIGLENIAGGMGTAAFLAYLASLCNTTFTATQYALLSALFAVPRIWLSASAGVLAQWLGWVDFFIVTAAAAVPGLVLLVWLMRLTAGKKSV